MTTFRLSRIALAGALALGLGAAFTVAPALTGTADIAEARGGGGGGGGGPGGGDISSVPSSHDRPTIRGGRGTIAYSNEFPEEEPPVIIIPFPRQGVAPVSAQGPMAACVEQRDAYRSVRVICERGYRR